MPALFRTMRTASLMALVVFSVPSCADRTLAIVDLDQAREERIDFDVSENRDVDILFVVDNSNSMEREQASLAAKFSNVIDALSRHPDGLPSIHIAVVSTDLGGGGTVNPCSVSGDGGDFLGSSCPTLDGTFLRSIVVEGAPRDENFTGSLPETFACMATLGNRGCGFEQPLESMRRALSGPQSAEFLRDHAYLAVVIVSDEDDCSARDPSMYDGASQDLDSVLGPPKSFRCFEFGVQCDQDDDLVRTPGPRSGCVPRDSSEFLYDVDEYVQFLYSLKASPEQILVATIAGDLSPLKVVERHDERLNIDYVALDYSCTEDDAEAVPPVRLSAFVSGFGEENGQRTSICDADLSGALEDIGRLITEKASACLKGELADRDATAPGLQPDCIVSLTESGQEEQRLPECDNAASPRDSTTLPCFTLLPNETCSATPTGLSPKVHYPEGFIVPIGTDASVRCLAP